MKTRHARDLVRKRTRLISRLPDMREVLRGSLVERYRRCGRSNCHCVRSGDRGHGPAYYLVVTLGLGKTLQIYVPREDKEDVARWVKNFKVVRETMEEISTLNRELLKKGRPMKRRG